MKPIPRSDNSLVLRTDFSDAVAWESLCTAIREPAGKYKFRAYVEFVSDPEYDRIDMDQLLSITRGANLSFIFIVDRIALVQPDHPILVVDLLAEPGRKFRVIPSEMWSVENNLSIANMDFEEFAEAVDADGVFRGFPDG